MSANNFYFYQNQKSNPMKKLTTKIQLILFTALLAGFTSCSDDDDAGMITEESETIADFVASERMFFFSRSTRPHWSYCNP